jgi:hypothetical protein
MLSLAASRMCAVLQSAALPEPIITVDCGGPDATVALQVGEVILRLRATPGGVVADVMPATAGSFMDWRKLEATLGIVAVPIPRELADEAGVHAIASAFVACWPDLARPRDWRAELQALRPTDAFEDAFDAFFREIFESGPESA